jgi:hypothetical protein
MINNRNTKGYFLFNEKIFPKYMEKAWFSRFLIEYETY